MENKQKMINIPKKSKGEIYLPGSIISAARYSELLDRENSDSC